MPPSRPTGRLIELDILRGFLLLWMTLTHLPTRASVISNQTFGFVSGAEGFIFLAGFMIGQLTHRLQQKLGEGGTNRDLAKRTARVYLYHCTCWQSPSRWLPKWASSITAWRWRIFFLIT